MLRVGEAQEDKKWKNVQERGNGGAKRGQGSLAKEEINTYVKTCFCAPVPSEASVAAPHT